MVLVTAMVALKTVLAFVAEQQKTAQTGELIIQIGMVNMSSLQPW